MALTLEPIEQRSGASRPVLSSLLSLQPDGSRRTATKVSAKGLTPPRSEMSHIVPREVSLHAGIWFSVHRRLPVTPVREIVGVDRQCGALFFEPLLGGGDQFSLGV